MRFSIVHRTVYRYTGPVHSTIQTLRLTPRREPHQRPLRWRLHAPGRLTESQDAYGNVAHTLALHVPHGQLAIEVHGEIEIDALRDGRLDEEAVSLPTLLFAAPTPLTDADDALRDFAGAHLTRPTPSGLLDFGLAIRDTIKYTSGATHVGTRAADTLKLRRGVCQDHAHVFIAGCRARGIPARYVSGYYYTTATPHAASHAWADAWLPQTGWISVDVTHGRFAAADLCRLAIGRDYDSACPVRGVRLGGGAESMEVRVNMQPVAAE
jgi:transglutaminase-like putative cysteine protease